MTLKIDGLKIAVFDWDNTLAESRTALVYAINQILPEYGLPEWEIVKCVRDNNLSFRDNFPRIFGEKADEAYEKYTKIYLKNVGKMISTFPATHEVLSFFKNKNVLLMIMSNKDRNLLEYELPLLFSPELFDNIVCGHEAQKDKPYENHLYYTVKKYLRPEEITPQNVWVIGDSPQDSTCARRSGAKAIRIGQPIWKEDELEKPHDICFFESFVKFYEELLNADNLQNV